MLALEKGCDSAWLQEGPVSTLTAFPAGETTKTFDQAKDRKPGIFKTPFPLQGRGLLLLKWGGMQRKGNCPAKEQLRGILDHPQLSLWTYPEGQATLTGRQPMERGGRRGRAWPGLARAGGDSRAKG